MYVCLHLNYEGLILTPVVWIVSVLICFSSQGLRAINLQTGDDFVQEKKGKVKNKDKNVEEEEITR